MQQLWPLSLNKLVTPFDVISEFAASLDESELPFTAELNRYTDSKGRICVDLSGVAVHDPTVSCIILSVKYSPEMWPCSAVCCCGDSEDVFSENELREKFREYTHENTCIDKLSRIASAVFV